MNDPIVRSGSGYDLRADDDPIVALATPWGESAIALIRAAGAGSVELAARLFRGGAPLEGAAERTLSHGRIMDPHDGEIVDEVLVAVFRAPRSYTGQDGVEVSCHGGPAVIARILAVFLDQGFRQAGPGEFTLRAFLNGRMDLTRAEAVNELIRARSDRARSQALSRLSGSVARRIDALKERVLYVQSALELRLDYPEEEVDAPLPDVATVRDIRADVDRLLSTYAAGRLVQEGARLAIAGRANAGKSTLFNLLLREDRSIVSDAPGTTRDYIEGSISIRGFGFRVFDTAGLREAEGAVELEGIRRTRRVIESADIVAYLVDGSCGLEPEDRSAMEEIGVGKLVAVWSKADLAASPPPVGFTSCSGRTGSGLEELHAAILSRLLVGGLIEADNAVIDSVRQKQLIERCRDALDRAASALAASRAPELVAVDVREALDALGEITGEVTSADVLEAMFSSFCVGK